MFAAAQKAAAGADVIIIAIGIDGSLEGENHDYRAFSTDGTHTPFSPDVPYFLTTFPFI